MKKFSIIVPCYNLEEYAGRTIESVLRQTYRDFELIVIDDGSTDQTLKIIRAYEVKDKRIKVYAKDKNQGLSAARNTGIENSIGEYVLFLDGDDVIKEELLEKAVEILDQNKIDMFSYGYKIVEEQSQKVIRIRSQNKYDKNIFSGIEFLKLYLQKKISQHICSLIIRRKIFSENLILFGEDIKYGEDQDFQLRCMAKCKKIYYTSKEYFYYTQRTGSLINRKVPTSRADELEVFLKIEEDLKNDIEPFYVRNYTCFHYVYLYREVMKKGTEKEFILKYIKKDYLLNGFKMSFTKHNIITLIFILSYKLFLRKALLVKYGI